MNKSKIIHWFIIGTFVSLYLAVSIISTLHVIKFFELSNPYWLSVSLAVAFELGAAASLASLIVLDKMNKFLVWSLFIVLTLFQSMGNVYYAYVNLHDFSGWVELFDLVDEDLIYQKRILSMISGGILPFVALGFIKSLVDYIRPSNQDATTEKEESPEESVEQVLDGGEIKEIQQENSEEQLNKIEEIVEEKIEENPGIFEENSPEEVLIVNVPTKFDEPLVENEIPEEMTNDEIETILGINPEQEFIEEDEEIEEEPTEDREIFVDPNVSIPIPRKDPNQSY
jgi:hypothetical protein